MEKNFHRKTNDSMALGYYGLSCSHFNAERVGYKIS